jgi:hypothetical protein
MGFWYFSIIVTHLEKSLKIKLCTKFHENNGKILSNNFRNLSNGAFFKCAKSHINKKCYFSVYLLQHEPDIR